MKLSIVTTMYKSENHLEQFYHRIRKTISELQVENFEIIFVDDGSPDNSVEVIKKLMRPGRRIKLIELSRNFGHHFAIMTGLAHAKGELIFVIDSDLEEEPELLRQFWYEFFDKPNRDGEVEVVFGYQLHRKGKFMERVSGSIFYSIYSVFVKTGTMKRNVLTVRLMSRKFVKALLKFDEREFYFAPVSSIVGFNQLGIPVKKLSISKTSYSSITKYNLAINSLFNFSIVPLYFVFYAGLLTSAIALVAGVSLLIKILIYGSNVDGWASLMISLWGIGGFIIFSLGIVAIYVSKIFIETKKRPFTIIKDITE